MRRYLTLLGRRDYALLWGGATVSALGDGMSFVALVWLLVERGRGAADIGLLSALYTAPVVVGGLAAGVILDRFDRRRVIAADNLIRGLFIASVPVADALGVLTTGQLYVVAAVYGLLFMTSVAGIPSLIPTLVDQDDLTTANAMESISYGIAGLVGPTLAGVVIAIVGATSVLAVDAATYGVFVACLLAMREGGRHGATVHPVAPTDPTAGGLEVLETEGLTEQNVTVRVAPAPNAGTGLGPAIRFVLGAPAIVATTLMYMCMNISAGMAIVLVPVYARDVLAGDATTFGLILSAQTAGELLGLVVIGAIGWRWPLGRSIAGASLVCGAILSALLLRPALLGTIAILGTAGFVESSLTPWAQTIRMRILPAHLRGRVFALLRTLMQSTRPIGSVVAGVLLAGGELTATLAIIALLVAVPGAIGLVIPALGPEATGERVPIRARGSAAT